MLALPTVRRVAYFAFAATAAQAEGGMPQLDQTWYPNQLLWLAVSFVALYFIVARSIAPTVGGVIAARDSAINDAIAEAEEAKKAAESTRGNFESAGLGARTKAAELLATAQADNSRDATEAMHKLDHDLHRKAEQADVRIGEALAKAEANVVSVTDELARTMVAKLLGDSDGPVAAKPKKLKKA